MARHRTTVSLDEHLHAVLVGLADEGVIDSVSAFINDAVADFVNALELFTVITDDYNASLRDPGDDPLPPFKSLEAYQSSDAQHRLQEAHQVWLSTRAGSLPISEATERLLTSYAAAEGFTSAPASSGKPGEAEVA
jgi:hypothetical protein